MEENKNVPTTMGKGVEKRNRKPTYKRTSMIKYLKYYFVTPKDSNLPPGIMEYFKVSEQY